jgi:hypothetical protein
MSAVVLLEWKFSPSDYFEERIEVSGHGYTMTIADGKVEAKIESAIYDANPSIRQEVQDHLNCRFMGDKLYNYRTHELFSSTMTRVHPDGRREFFIGLESGCYVMSGGSVDFRNTDKDGNIISDSKRDRIERKRSLGELLAAHPPSDKTLTKMQYSFSGGMRDPNNELIYLYEIRDALLVKFGDEKCAQTTLAFPRDEWSRLGKLCNKEPLRQGRHRGRTDDGVLRDASKGELDEARAIARTMIEAYLQYLEGCNRQGSS